MTETKDLQQYIPAGQPAAIAPFGSLQGFEVAQRIAKALMSADIVPAQFRDNVGNCLIAMEMASRTGSSVLAVMQSIYMVHGTPGWSGQYCIAALNQSRKFAEPIHFEFQGAMGKDDWGCRAVTTSKGGKRIEGPLVTIAIAKAEGWYNRQGSKWKTIPELMLRYRSASWLAKTEAPEVLMGMQTTDELMDIGEVPLPRPLKIVDVGEVRVVDESPAAKAPAEDTFPKRIGPGQYDVVDRDGVIYSEAVDQDDRFLFGWSTQHNAPAHSGGSFRCARGKQEPAEAYRKKVILAKGQVKRQVPAESEPKPAADTSVTGEADTDAWQKDYEEADSDGNQAQPKTTKDEWDMN